MNFSHAEFSDGTVQLSKTGFSGGTVHFEFARFSCGTVDFSAAGFFGGIVIFTCAVFSGGTVSFEFAGFSGTVIFFDAEFSGSAVDFRSPYDWSRPPEFPWTDTSPPGVKLPTEEDHPKA